jgi:TolB protein
LYILTLEKNLKLNIMKILILISCFLVINFSFAQNPVGIFQDHTDVGNPKIKGSAVYDQATQTYTLKGAGYNIWFARDEFQYAFNKLQGDFILTAQFEFVGKGTEGHRKIGWMVRESTDEDAVHMSATYHGDGLTVLQWRMKKGMEMRDPQDEIRFAKGNAQIIQLERSGKVFTMRVAKLGEPLQTVGSTELENMPEEVLAGLFICSHNPDVIEEAKIWNVRIDKPLPADYDPYQNGFVGSRLETMNVFDGKRTVIYESDKGFEAPNWMPDGKNLLFNQGGLLYEIPATGGKIVQHNAGGLEHMNNDHGISFDGKMLAVSSSREGLKGGGSTVYVLPLTGGTPKMITPETPSYFHGWAADNKNVYYVAQRDTAIYNVYRCDLSGGKEVQLTFNKSHHVDGPEESPDGKYIYFNGSMTGTMQIWRMKPDGSGLEQLTFDQYNDWFPHISPDGKWMVFISFPDSIEPNNHPAYKRVMLRIMPVSGGAPKVIAYLYGGQGTINVASWSPDSKHIAFMSNPGMK